MSFIAEASINERIYKEACVSKIVILEYFLYGADNEKVKK